MIQYLMDIIPQQGRRQGQNFGGAIWGSWGRGEEDEGMTYGMIFLEVLLGFGGAIQKFE